VSTPEAFRQQTVTTLCRVLLERSRQQPLIIGIENLHWSDPSSEVFLTTLVEELVGAPLCVLTTSRPGYHPP
jgi:predicted ATPase